MKIKIGSVVRQFAFLVAALCFGLGLILGLYLAEKPPYDWQKWGVFGTWASVFVVVLLTFVGATLPQRLSKEEHIRKHQSLAKRLASALALMEIHFARVLDWLNGDRDHYTDINQIFPERTSKLVEHFRGLEPNIAHLLDDVKNDIRNLEEALHVPNGSGGFERATTPEAADKISAEASCVVAQIHLDSALKDLCEQYNIPRPDQETTKTVFNLSYVFPKQ
ncbi:MAG: hypothetical protein HWE08_13855 [Alphaproteobacteria bacterium]|nr:hypothetical protein [Alphaproteobacteria bacterium]